MVVLRNGRFLCRGRGCHTIYDAAEVIDRENPDFAIYARSSESCAMTLS